MFIEFGDADCGVEPKSASGLQLLVQDLELEAQDVTPIGARANLGRLLRLSSPQNTIRRPFLTLTGLDAHPNTNIYKPWKTQQNGSTNRKIYCKYAKMVEDVEETR